MLSFSPRSALYEITQLMNVFDKDLAKEEPLERFLFEKFPFTLVLSFLYFVLCFIYRPLLSRFNQGMQTYLAKEKQKKRQKLNKLLLVLLAVFSPLYLFLVLFEKAHLVSPSPLDVLIFNSKKTPLMFILRNDSFHVGPVLQYTWDRNEPLDQKQVSIETLYSGYIKNGEMTVTKDYNDVLSRGLYKEVFPFREVIRVSPWTSYKFRKPLKGS